MEICFLVLLIKLMEHY